MAKSDAKARILERVEHEKVKFLRLQFTDILGVIKNVEVPDRQFAEALDGNIMFDGSSIRGYKRIEQSDMYFQPDLDTYQVIPWLAGESGNVARIICDVADPDGTPFDDDAEKGVGLGNLIGGITTGVLAHDLSFSNALQTYGALTIGDGSMPSFRHWATTSITQPSV